MTQASAVSSELDRLITLGHQDASLVTALQRKFPDLTEAELAAGFAKVISDRSLKNNAEPHV
jgi:hypothetical protein